MQVNSIADRKKDIVMNYDLDERQVYIDALEKFSHGETYENTPDPMRASLQHDYACFVVDCFKREKRNISSHTPLFLKI
ncbi:MAG: hypothetical protein ACYSR9_02175 [Planctomycetota bacterium]|jgi:hypothetical protein